MKPCYFVHLLGYLQNFQIYIWRHYDIIKIYKSNNDGTLPRFAGLPRILTIKSKQTKKALQSLPVRASRDTGHVIASKYNAAQSRDVRVA